MRASPINSGCTFIRALGTGSAVQYMYGLNRSLFLEMQVDVITD